MNLNNQTNNRQGGFLRQATTLWLLIFVFGSVFFGFYPQTTIANTPASSYIISLQPGRDAKILNAVVEKISKRFEFTPNSEFSNIYTFESNLSLSELRLQLSSFYNYLEINRGLASQAVFVNDPGFTTNPQDIDKQWALPKTGFNSVWSTTTGSKDNVVGIIDTGIDATHEDLRTINFKDGFNFVSRQEIKGVVNSDDNGHGTLVAGILGATANNGVGIAGTNWLISIMPLKALDSTGKGDAAAVSEAIVWATDHGANFLNLSIGGIGFGHDTTLANAIAYAFNRNVVVVAAAGNDQAVNGKNLDQDPVYPICEDNNYNMVIGVAAVDQNDIKTTFSNYGKNCIDVVAPGRRILSTINFDPITKISSPNSYAYASGTSLAVPYVVGQAALIRALYPFATNVQIRDRIMSTADQIEDANLTQCSGSSCRGFLGAGRINVIKSLQGEISIQSLSEGELVQVENSSIVYLISGGQKRLISSFVLNQRYQGTPVKKVSSSQLVNFPEGPYASPVNETLVKWQSDPTVFIIDEGKKLPITYQVFQQRKFNFNDVNTVSFSEIDSWITGQFFASVDGTLLRTAKDKTLYWVVGESLHPINHAFYIERGLNIFPVIIVADEDIQGFAKGEAFIR